MADAIAFRRPALLLAMLAGLLLATPASAGADRDWGPLGWEALFMDLSQLALEPELAAVEARLVKEPSNSALYRRAFLLLRRHAISSMGESEAVASAREEKLWNEALALVRRWAAAAPGEESLVQLALMTGDGAEAAGVLWDLVRREPDSVRGHRELAAMLSRLGRARDGESLLRNLVARRPDDPAVWGSLVAHLAAQSPSPEVASALAAWRKRLPDDRHGMLAVLRYRGMDLLPAEAEALVDAALAGPQPWRDTLDERRHEAREACEALARVGQVKAALHCQQLLSKTPGAEGDGIAAAHMVELLANARRWRELDAFLAAQSEVMLMNLEQHLQSAALRFANWGDCQAVEALHARADKIVAAPRTAYGATQRAAASARCGDEAAAAAELRAAIVSVSYLSSLVAAFDYLPAHGPLVDAMLAALQQRVAERPDDEDSREALDALLRRQASSSSPAP